MFSNISFGPTMLTVELPGGRHRVATRTIEELLAGKLFPPAIPGEDEPASQGGRLRPSPLPSRRRALLPAGSARAGGAAAG